MSTAEKLPPNKPARLRRRSYATLGCLLAAGAPLGLLLLRRLGATPRRRLSRGGGFAWTEIARDPWLYGYVSVATAVAFGLFGRALGSRADRLRAQQAELDEIRDEFAALVAHDLRHPIATIMMQTEELLHRQQADELHVPRSALRRIRTSAVRLNQMIDDLVDASRIELGRVTLKLRPVLLDRAVASIVERLKPLLTGRQLEIDLRPAPAVEIDPLRFDQVLTNLIDNAVKYSTPGTLIRIAVGPTHDGAFVSVSDQGVGIAPDDLGRLFDRFFQTRRARARSSGMGLGLYITRGLVEAHRGRICADSVLGRGSTFTVMLPASGQPRAGKPRP